MKAGDILRFALGGIAMNRLRSVLTTLGIMIGVGAVILLVAVGNGSAQQIEQNIESLGTNTLTVFGGSFGPGAATGGQVQSQNQDLTVEVARALADPETAPHVKSVSPEVTTQATATYEGATHDLGQLVGTYPSYFEASNSPVGEGTYFTNDDVLQARKVVVLGRSVVEDLFGDVDPIGQQVVDRRHPIPGRRRPRGPGVHRVPGRERRRRSLRCTTVQQTLTGYGALSQILVQATSRRRRRRRRGRDHRDPGQRAERRRPDERPVPDPQPVAAARDELGDDPDVHGPARRRRRPQPAGRRHRDHEHHARRGHGADPRDRDPQGRRRGPRSDPRAVPARGHAPQPGGRAARRRRRR